MLRPHGSAGGTVGRELPSGRLQHRQRAHERPPALLPSDQGPRNPEYVGHGMLRLGPGGLLNDLNETGVA
eukprot:5125367-Lingulodinium_polyedra.AAC.1